MRSISKVQSTGALGVRHRDSGHPRTSANWQLAFSEYVSNTRDRLRCAHAGRPADILEKVVDGNAPFELFPPSGSNVGVDRQFRRGVLLTHGLSDSPYMMRHLGAFFQENGFRVMAILLPGHGTQPGDLLNVNWNEWAHEVAYGVEQLSHDTDEIYLAGFSAGAALSVYQSLVDPRIRGLLLFSPALRISRKAKLATLHKLYSRVIPSGRWLDIKPDLDIYKYESFPKNAAAQMYTLTRAVDALLAGRKLDIPLFIAASADDTTVDVQATLEFMWSTGNPRNKLVLYIADRSKIRNAVELLSDRNQSVSIELVDCVIPEQKILSSSHSAVVLPAEDAHYGSKGAYAGCAHYYPRDMEKYSACIKSPQDCLLGELTKKNLGMGLLRRLTYNPKFKELKAAMKLFVDSLP